MAEPRDPDRPVEPPVREREVIVTDGGRRGGGVGAIVGVVALVAVLVIVLFATGIIGGGDGDGVDTPTIEVPDQVDIDVSDAGGGEG